MGRQKGRHRIGYAWRLFLPLVAALWLIILAVAVYQHRTEAGLRKKVVDNELHQLTSRIVAAYDSGEDLATAIDFAARYYEHSAFSGIRISVYDSRGRLLHCVGTPIPHRRSGTSVQQRLSADTTGHGSPMRHSPMDPSQAYYHFGIRTSADGGIYVYTAMPYTPDLSRELAVGRGLWLLVAALAVGAALFAYITAQLLGRDIRRLRHFAACAAAGEPLPPGDALPPGDELGDIASQIRKLHADKNAALGLSAHEHELAQRANEEKISITRELTNNINHELKTPIGVIRGYLDTIAAHPEMMPDVRSRFVDNARDATARLCVLLNDVAALTRLEQGGDTIAIEAIDFGQLLSRLSAELAATRMAANVAFSYHLASSPCIVMANYELLYGAVMNLVRNADLHSHGTRCELRVIATSAGDYTFSFADDGVGVEEHHLPRLFDRFYRVDRGRSRRVGGTGLGLPIVKDTIAIFGGTIFARNRQGGGLELVFTLLRPSQG